MNTTTTPDRTNATEAQFLAPETHQRAGGQSQARSQESDELQYVPLNKLLVSPLNVRKSGGENVDELAALIASQGLLQNLVAVPHKTKKGKATDKFEVVAGGRRLRALIKLAQAGTLATDEQILCRIVSREGALATSAAENSGREAMSAADTVQAFADMVNGGATVEEISVCFGITPLTVRRRLKLAGVSPRLFALFREGGIELEQLMALAVTDDHAKQEAVWEGAHPWDRQPHALRRALLGTARSLRDPLVRFVGHSVYVAAGGAVVRDLFAEDDSQSAHLADPALVELLANEKLAGIAAEVRAEGWAWVEPVLSFTYSERRAFLEARPTRREPTQAEAEQIEAQRSARDTARNALEAFYEDGEDDGSGEGEGDGRAAALETAAEGTEAALAAAMEALRSWPAEVMAHAGAFVSVGHDGEAEVIRGLVKPEDRERASAAQAAAAQAEGEGNPSDADYPSTFRSHRVGRDLDSPMKAKEKAEYSEPLMRRLAAHRTKALQALVADNAQVALAVLAHTMVLQVIEARQVYRSSGSSSADVVARPCDSRLALDADELHASPAWVKLQEQVESWGERLPGDSDRLLPWLIGQPQETVVDLLALCTALTLDTGPMRGAGNHGAIAQAVGLDMADWWTPTAGSFLSHVPKAKMAEAVKEAVSTTEAGKLDKLKKAEAVTKAETLLMGTRWLPMPLRPNPEA